MPGALYTQLEDLCQGANPSARGVGEGAGVPRERPGAPIRKVGARAGRDLVPAGVRARRGDPAGRGGHRARADRNPAALPGPVPAGGPHLPRAALGGARGDRHDGIRQRAVQRPGRAPGQEPPGRRGADAVRAGHVGRIRRPGRPGQPGHPVQPGGRHLHRGPDAVRRWRRGRVGAGTAAGDLRLQPRLLVRAGRARPGRSVHRGRSAPPSLWDVPPPPAPAPPPGTASWTPIAARAPQAPAAEAAPRARKAIPAG